VRGRPKEKGDEIKSYLIAACLLAGFAAPVAARDRHYRAVQVADVEEITPTGETVFLPNNSWCTLSACYVSPGEVRSITFPPEFLAKATLNGEKLLLRCEGRSSECRLEYPAEYEGEVKSNGVVLLYVSVDGQKPHNVKFRIVGPWK